LTPTAASFPTISSSSSKPPRRRRSATHRTGSHSGRTTHGREGQGQILRREPVTRESALFAQVRICRACRRRLTCRHDVEDEIDDLIVRKIRASHPPVQLGCSAMETRPAARGYERVGDLLNLATRVQHTYDGVRHLLVCSPGRGSDREQTARSVMPAHADVPICAR
jgi:hypothetical protein